MRGDEARDHRAAEGEGPVLWALARISHACERQSRQRASTRGLSGLELECLRRVADARGAALAELVACPPLGEATLVEVYRRLESRRLVVIREDPWKAGALVVRPTEAGRDVTLSEPPPPHSRLAAALARLPEREREAIATALCRVALLIEEEPPTAGPKR